MTTLNLGGIGDSITAATYLNPGEGPLERCAAAIAAALGWTVNVTNRGNNGTTTAVWRSDAAEALLTSARADFVAASVTDVLMMLGANDCNASVSAATYGANVLDSATYLAGQGFRVWLNYPIYADWDDGLPGNPFLVQYQPQVDAAVNGTARRLGDTTGYARFLADGGTLSLDGVHPNATGANVLGGLWAAPLITYFTPPVRISFKGGRLRRR